MPFRDREWEDFQRDCDFFPAYTDYVFGVDTRPHVADEPGLHPQTFDPPPRRPQRICSLPPPVQRPVAYDSPRSAVQPRLPLVNAPKPSLLRQESSLDTLLSTPTPAPRTLRTPSPPTALLRPGELATNPHFSFISQQERVLVNKNVVHAWSIIRSDAIPLQKAKAAAYLKRMSRMVTAKRQEYEVARLQMEEMRAQQETQWCEDAEKACLDKFATSEARQPEADTGCPAERVRTDNHDLSQLSTYVQSRLPQLWACTEIIALRPPPADPVQLQVHRQAQQYLLGFKQSLPPQARPWFDMVVDGMLNLRRQGGDPMLVLLAVPRIQDVFGMG